MNKQEAVIYLASTNARNFAPMREDDAIELGLSYFKVSTAQSGRLDVSMHAYETHDNAPRMPFVCNYLKTQVFPNTRGKLDGCYPIQLHDSYTHIGAPPQNILTFAKHKAHAQPVLLPDPFMLSNYGGRLSIADNIPYDQKQDKVGFFGVTTGHTDPQHNHRLKLCQWSKAHRDATEFFITNIAQIEPSVVSRAYPDLEAIMHPPIAQEQQYNYKYILSMDGNTASYDRPPWAMNSRSLLFKYRSNDILWYYPLLHEGTQFVGVDDANDILNKRLYFNANPGHAQYIIQNANHFVKTFLTPATTLLYTTYLFEAMAENAA